MCTVLLINRPASQETRLRKDSTNRVFGLVCFSQRKNAPLYRKMTLSKIILSPCICELNMIMSGLAASMTACWTRHTWVLFGRQQCPESSKTGVGEGGGRLWSFPTGTASLAQWVRRLPRKRKIPGSNPACDGIFPGSDHTSDLKIGTPVTILPGAWRYRVSTGNGRPGVSIL